MSFSYSISVEAARRYYDYDDKEHWMGGVSVPPSIKKDTLEFQRMVGCEFDFHGEQCSMVRLNDLVYEFLKDPDDGYRSHMGAVACSQASEHTGFFPNAIARVILVDTNKKESWPDEWVPPVDANFPDAPFNGFYFIDADDFHVWCKIGTEYGDAYYPMFICWYNPRQGT